MGKHITDIVICLRLVNPIQNRVKAQHPAASSAVVATPGVFFKIEVHLASRSLQKGPICIDLIRQPSSDIQAEDVGHVQNAEWKVVFFLIAHSGTSLEKVALLQDKHQLAIGFGGRIYQDESAGLDDIAAFVIQISVKFQA